MTLSAVLLRVLLSLALVLNGTGAAVAAVHAPAPHMDAALAQAMASDKDAPCHHDAAMAAKHAPIADHGSCCKGMRCDRAGPAPALLEIAFAPVAPALPPPAFAMQRLDAGHRAPALAHPIRPPIG
jgi:hypothetical protein